MQSFAVAYQFKSAAPINKTGNWDMELNPFRATESSFESAVDARPKGFFRVGDLFLAIGFLTLAIASGLSQFVMIGLLGLVLFPISLGSLLIAGAVVAGENRSTWKRHVAGFAIFILGVFVLNLTSVVATTLACNYVTRPVFASTLSTYSWAFVALGWGMSGGTIAASFMLTASGSRTRCFFWGSIALAVPPASLLIFLILFWSGQALGA
ncbi:hypothetical protein N9B46_02880 [Mariniblastus sp.]|nr:hypothetical protein [bacterium]MDA7925768.1 hypothetical protein [Mariniblastus sp.]MDB4481031.1 hypothetical protein [bacterium]